MPQLSKYFWNPPELPSYSHLFKKRRWWKSSRLRGTAKHLLSLLPWRNGRKTAAYAGIGWTNRMWIWRFFIRICSKRFSPQMINRFRLVGNGSGISASAFPILMSWSANAFWLLGRGKGGQKLPCIGRLSRGIAYQGHPRCRSLVHRQSSEQLFVDPRQQNGMRSCYGKTEAWEWHAENRIYRTFY